jgi:2-oxoglutarate ferredoxin oxidoreductase subunit gamma
MRGGTAHCTVIVSDDEIGSPLVRRPAAVIALNLPSRDKYAPVVASGGVLVVNASLVPHATARSDIRVIEIPANEIAEELGNVRLANVVLLGALLATVQTLGVPLEALERALGTHLPERHRDLLDMNRRALRRGAALAAGEILEAQLA